MPELNGPCFSLSFGPASQCVPSRDGVTPGLSNTWTLPSFVSSAPPRSEGEALLHRIFSRGTRM
jgi:hypothetical protein